MPTNVAQVIFAHEDGSQTIRSWRLNPLTEAFLQSFLEQVAGPPASVAVIPADIVAHATHAYEGKYVQVTAE